MSSEDELAPPSTGTPIPGTDRGRRLALGVALLGAVIAVAIVASPLWVGLMLGTVMAFSAQPLFRWLVSRTRRRRLAAGLTTAAGALVLVLVSALTVYVIVDELVAVTRAAKVDVTTASAMWPRALLSRISRGLGLEDAALSHRIEAALGDTASALAEGAGVVVRGVGEGLLSFVIALWTMYYVLVNWPRLAARLERLLPLDPRHTRALILEFRNVGRSAFVGTVATAFAQGLLAYFGYLMAGLPHALALAVLTGIASFLPLFGTAFVFIPVAIFQMASGDLARGFIILAWSFAIVVGFADYVVRPRLVGTGSATDPLLMLVALLGGLEVFGFSGLIVGPMIMSLFIAVAHIYETEVSAAPLQQRALDAYKRL